MVAGKITLDRRVIILEGTVAIVIATVCLSVVLGGPGPGAGLLAAIAVLVPYLLVSGVSAQRLGKIGLPPAWVQWLSDAVAAEDQELEPAIHPPRATSHHVALAGFATIVVVGASIAMELTASTLGARHHFAEIVIGALVLAGVTSLPNAGAPSGQGTLVAGCYLGLTAVTLACAYAGRGLRRAHGALILAGYLAFLAAVLITR